MRNKSILADAQQYCQQQFCDLPLFASLTEKSETETPAESERWPLDDGENVGDTLSSVDHRILELLRDRPHEQAILGPALCRAVGIAPTPNGQRRLRTIVAHLVELGYPLGTARTGEHRGFFWLTKPEDRKAAAAHLRHQAIKILRRADRLEKSSAAAEHRGQLRLAG